MANNLEKYNRRSLIKRTTHTGVLPTIPVSILSGGTAEDVLDHTAGGWLYTDLYVGEFFMNVEDDKLWMRSNNGIQEIDTVSGHSYFYELPDTPGNYIGSANKLLAVNASEDAIEFITNTNISTIVGLSDTPSSITEDKILVGTSSSTYEEQDYINKFNKLTDIDNFYGNGGKIYRVNITEDGLETISLSSVCVDLVSNQSIYGIKSFQSETVFNDDVTFNSDIVLNGNNFSDLITDSGLTTASNTNIVSTLAIKDYIDNQVITAIGGDYVPRLSDIDIFGEKTFNGETIFNDDIVTNGEIHSYDIMQNISSYHYFGNDNTDGSYRFFINPVGDLEIQKRESGVWTYKANF